ncbi:MAG TPA: MerR family transcriptional regulator [Anaeromyxobacteraceae bacterium]|nr:MerR family transcriptional regulator [Anaeromyxobacteraceae bacterium]
MRADFSSGDLARATGNTVRAIRHYEEEGLLKPAEVSDGGHRRYTEDDLERLRLITDLRELGLALCEIRSILELRRGCQTAAEFAARFRQVIEVHLGEAQRRLERLRRMKKEILDSLAVVEARLRGDGGAQCPCAVAEAASVPRIVKVLARQQGCACGGFHEAHGDGRGGGHGHACEGDGHAAARVADQAEQLDPPEPLGHA